MEERQVRVHLSMTDSLLYNVRPYDGPSKEGIVFFDLDGTLLDNDANAVPQSTLRALSLLREHFHVVLSTGRDMDTHYSVRHKETVRPDAIIHQNGNKITVGEQLLFRHEMDRTLLMEIYDYCREHGFCVGTSIGTEDFFLHPEKKAAADAVYTKATRRNFVPFEELFSREIPVTALSYAGNLEVEKPLIEARFPMLELFAFNGDIGADVVERGYSKGEGLKRICKYYGVDPAGTYAFGDSLNDLSLLQAAGTGIAMGNAVQRLKEKADYVTEDVSRDGIYLACVRLGLIPGN